MAERRSPAEKAQIRLASLTIAGAVAIWLAVSALGGALGLPLRWAFLADMLCLAALAWAGWLLFNVWRKGAGKE